jgi:ABC-type lipoprotein release transport system permease subunit
MVDAFYRGFIIEMFNNQIKQHISHVQIHKDGFEKEKNVKKIIPDYQNIEKVLSSAKNVKYYSKRTLVYGLISSANSSAGIALIGVEPDKEKNITNINEQIIKGKYFSGKPNEIVIGKKAAEKLEVELGDKVVAIASDVDGNVSNELFRVVGIFKSVGENFDQSNAYIPLKTAQNMLGLGNDFHEFAIITNDTKFIVNAKKELVSKIKGDYEILSFQDLMPMMMYYLEMYDQMIWIYYAIFGLAVLFGVVNTMLMSVFERINEFGVLLSIGMKRMKLFNMVILEALVLGVCGTGIGVVLGFLGYIPMAVYGVDLSIYSEGLSSFGMASIVYPKLELAVFLNNILIMPFITVLGAIYPARKALKLQPTDAMRYV